MNITESTNHLFEKLEQLNERKIVVKTKNKYTKTKKKNKIQTICIDCGNEKTEAYKTGSFQCESCNDKLINRIKSNLREIDKKESRIGFLYRESKRRGLNQSKYDIKLLINRGFNDDYILCNDKTVTLWTYEKGNKTYY